MCALCSGVRTRICTLHTQHARGPSDIVWAASPPCLPPRTWPRQRRSPFVRPLRRGCAQSPPRPPWQAPRQSAFPKQKRPSSSIKTKQKKTGKTWNKRLLNSPSSLCPRHYRPDDEKQSCHYLSFKIEHTQGLVGKSIHGFVSLLQKALQCPKQLLPNLSTKSRNFLKKKKKKKKKEKKKPKHLGFISSRIISWNRCRANYTHPLNQLL